MGQTLHVWCIILSLAMAIAAAYISTKWLKWILVALFAGGAIALTCTFKHPGETLFGKWHQLDNKTKIDTGITHTITGSRWVIEFPSEKKEGLAGFVEMVLGNTGKIEMNITFMETKDGWMQIVVTNDRLHLHPVQRAQVLEDGRRATIRTWMLETFDLVKE